MQVLTLKFTKINNIHFIFENNIVKCVPEKSGIIKNPIWSLMQEINQMFIMVICFICVAQLVFTSPVDMGWILYKVEMQHIIWIIEFKLRKCTHNKTLKYEFQYSEDHKQNKYCGNLLLSVYSLVFYPGLFLLLVYCFLIILDTITCSSILFPNISS